jgi:hypothetical protein
MIEVGWFEKNEQFKNLQIPSGNGWYKYSLVILYIENNQKTDEKILIIIHSFWW